MGEGKPNDGELDVGAVKTAMRRTLSTVLPGIYWWVRVDDETGMSGTGRVAQVAVFEDGSAVLRWLKTRNTAGVSSSVLYDHVADLVWVHGRGDRMTGRLEAVSHDDQGPAPGTTQTGMSDAECRDFLDLLMASDGCGVSVERLTALANREAAIRGFSSWVVAYHEFAPRG